ncbi:MAG: glycosyltransferase [bacterium]|nr:glycosyltransferase [bacterium]
MNILYVVPFANIRVKQFTQYLEQLGNKVQVIDVSPCWVAETSLVEGKYYAGKQQLDNLTYVNPPWKLKILPLKVLFSIPRIIRTIRSIARQKQTEVIIAYNPAVFTALPAWFARLGLSIPLAIYYLEMIAYAPTGMRFRRFVERLIVKRADYFIVLTEVMKNYVANKYHIAQKNIMVMKLAVDLKAYNPNLINLEKYRKEYQLRPGDRVLVNAGATYPVKTKHGWFDLQDVATLVRAMPIILQKYPQTKLILLGIENDKSIVNLVKELHLEKQVIILGRFMYLEEQHLSTMALADCLCLPSSDVEATRYFCKYKALDYMLAKKPIISVETVGLKETFKEAALYYEPNNSMSFANQVCYCFEHPEEMQTMAIKAYQILLSEHLWETESRRLTEFLQQQIKPNQIIEN